MNLNDLIEKGAFVSDKPVKTTVEWEKEGVDGKKEVVKFDVHIKLQSFATIESLRVEESDKWARVIADSILLGENGDQAIPFEKVKTLKPSLGNALIVAILKANKEADVPQKKSRPSRKSGTN